VAALFQEGVNQSEWRSAIANGVNGERARHLARRWSSERTRSYCLASNRAVTDTYRTSQGAGL